MNNNLIIKNARIITPLGTSALKGKEMNQLLDLTGGTVKVTDGVITYAGPSRPTCEEPEEGYEILNAEGRVLLPGFRLTYPPGIRRLSPRRIYLAHEWRKLYEHHATRRRYRQHGTCHS